MGNCMSQGSGQQVFGYYPCKCTEPILTDRAPRRSIGFFPNESVALYRYLKRRRQRDSAQLEGMIFCAKCNGYVSTPDHLANPLIPEVQKSNINNQQVQRYSNEPPPPYEEETKVALL